MTTISNEV
jgi:hypothetical protein